jgi:hypothetical protein
VEGLRIPRLQEDRPRTGELADETFAGADSADDASRRHALHDVLAIPRDKMAIVDDIAFALNQLPMQSAKRASPPAKSSQTYVFLDNCSKAGVPQQPIPGDLIHEKAFAAKHHLAETLALVLLDHALCTGNKRILPNRPLRLSIQP